MVQALKRFVLRTLAWLQVKQKELGHVVWPGSLRKFILRKQTLWVIDAVGVVVVSVMLVQTSIQPTTSPTFTIKVPVPSNPSEVKKPNTEEIPGRPVRLRIPKISVDAGVDYVGLTKQGDMDAPKRPDTVGWYSLGPRPGEEGSAVLDGHFGWKDNLPAVFDNLHQLAPGDVIDIHDEEGEIIHFVVRELQMLTPDDDATGVFRSSDGKAHLNLISCQGSWNSAKKSYSSRIVVFADRVK